MNDVNRRDFLRQSGALLGAAVLAPAPAGAAGAPAQWPPYSKALVIDACGAPSQTDTGTPLDAATLAAIRDSGVAAINFTLGNVGRYQGAFDEAIRSIAFWDGEIAAHREVLAKVTRGADIAALHATGRLGVIYGFQDTTMYGENLDRFDTFHALGVRIVQLTYNRRNLMGDGCMESGNAGLSRLGHEMIERMDALGTLLDLSHCGQRTTREGIEASKHPVAITHAGCAAVHDTPRNKRDEELRLLADRGGVAGIYFMPYLRASGQVTADDVIRHVEHALEVCGEDHVGIGSDGAIPAVDVTPEFKQRFAAEVEQRRKNGIAAVGENSDSYTFAPDLNSPRRLDTLAAMLHARGHGDARIEKILGGNFARLFREVIV